MTHLIDKSALVAEIDRQKIGYNVDGKHSVEYNTVRKVLDIIDTLEVKKVDIDKMLCFRRNTGFAYPEGASEYQRHLACYRQGIEDVLKAQKGE